MESLRSSRWLGLRSAAKASRVFASEALTPTEPDLLAPAGARLSSTLATLTSELSRDEMATLESKALESMLASERARRNSGGALALPRLVSGSSLKLLAGGDDGSAARAAAPPPGAPPRRTRERWDRWTHRFLDRDEAEYQRWGDRGRGRGSRARPRACARWSRPRPRSTSAARLTHLGEDADFRYAQPAERAPRRRRARAAARAFGVDAPPPPGGESGESGESGGAGRRRRKRSRHAPRSRPRSTTAGGRRSARARRRVVGAVVKLATRTPSSPRAPPTRTQRQRARTRRRCRGLGDDARAVLGLVLATLVVPTCAACCAARVRLRQRAHVAAAGACVVGGYAAMRARGLTRLVDWYVFFCALGVVLLCLAVARTLDAAQRVKWAVLRRATLGRLVAVRRVDKATHEIELHARHTEHERAAVEHALRRAAAAVADGGGGAPSIALRDLRLTRVLGRGAYGEVIAGTYHGTRIVLKRILRGRITPRNMELFAGELALMTRLRHPNVVMLIGATTDTFCNVGFVLERVERGDLTSLLADADAFPELTWADPLLRMAADVARGMAYIHGQHPPILHLDLKSLNVLVSSSFTCKVVDFGSPSARRSASPRTSPPSAARARSAAARASPRARRCGWRPR